MIASKRSLLRKEFEIFLPFKNEGLSELITRYCHLLSEMDEYEVVVSESEKVLKLSDVLPDKWDNYIMILKQSATFSQLKVNDLIGKLQSKELEMKKKAKIKAQSTSMYQEPSLYMGSMDSYPNPGVSGPKVQTAFFSGNAGDTVSNMSGPEFSFNTSSMSYGSNANAHPSSEGP